MANNNEIINYYSDFIRYFYYLNISDNNVLQEIFRYSKIIKESININNDNPLSPFFHLGNVDKFSISKRYENDFNKWREKHKSFNNMVAIAYPINYQLRNPLNCFLSLNGASTDYEGGIVNLSWGKKLNYEYKIVNELINKVFGFNFTECHLKDNFKRYVPIREIIKENHEHDIVGTPLKYPANFFNDYRLYNSKTYFERYYSCCEKKIAHYIGINYNDCFNLLKGERIINTFTSYEFRIKNEPCRMCRPILVGSYNILFGDKALYSYFYNNYHFVSLNSFHDRKEPLIMKRLNELNK